jgi:GrpB-like predicted nucleotidyltransferase (UPF0157 family)
MQLSTATIKKYAAKKFILLCLSVKNDPSYLNVAAFDTDMADTLGLRVINTTARQLADNINDTIMVAGNEAYQAALVFYNAVKAAAAQDIPGAKEVYDDLKARFPGRKHKTGQVY